MSETPKQPRRIEKLFAWISTDDNGEEGLIGGNLGPNNSFIPFVGSDQMRMESLKGYAKTIANRTGRPVQLKVFASGVTIDTLQPGASRS